MNKVRQCLAEYKVSQVSQGSVLNEILTNRVFWEQGFEMRIHKTEMNYVSNLLSVQHEQNFWICWDNAIMAGSCSKDFSALLFNTILNYKPKVGARLDL